jgi:DNA-binding beta-propeller fold protein YncE
LILNTIFTSPIAGTTSFVRLRRAASILTVPLQVNDPEYVAVDSQDSLYVADKGNSRVLKMTSSGVVSTLMLVLQPSAITVDRNGNVFVSGAKAVSKITPSGSISTVLERAQFAARAGAQRVGRPDYSRYRLERCSQAVVDGDAHYHRWNVAGFSGDGQPASAALLNSPADLAVDLTGAIWGCRFRQQSHSHAETIVNL